MQDKNLNIYFICSEIKLLYRYLWRFFVRFKNMSTGLTFVKCWWSDECRIGAENVLRTLVK